MAAASVADLFCVRKPGHHGSSLSLSWEGDPWARRGTPMNVLEQLFEIGNWPNSWMKNGLKGYTLGFRECPAKAGGVATRHKERAPVGT